MKKNKKATSILEAMIILLIIVSGILGLYKIYNNSQKISNSTKNRIEAIEISREGIESLKNIRDTNWLKFSGDTEHCFNTLNYNSDCVGGGTYPKISNGHYIVYKGNNSKWYLKKTTIPGNYEYKNSNYRNKFRVYKKDGYYTQTGSYNKETIFTREIKIENSTNTGFTIHSTIQWTDNSSSKPHKIDLVNTLTNWKKN